MTVFEQLIILVRYGIWGVAPDVISCNQDTWRELLLLAVEHSVQGHLYDAARRLPSSCGCPQEVLSSLERCAHVLEAGSRRLSAVADRQAETWRRHGINAVEIKGRNTAALYPVPEHRSWGDVDWWMPSDDDWDKSLAVVRANGISPETDSDGDISYQLGGVAVEHHRKGLEAEGPEGMLLLLNRHLMHHAMGAGAGLRQVLDLAVALDRYAGQYDRETYLRLLASRRMLRWNSVAEELAMHLRDGRPLGRRARALYDLVAADGNFGFRKYRRFGGLLRRTLFFLAVAPGPYVRHWSGLVTGRLRRETKVRNVSSDN